MTTQNNQLTDAEQDAVVAYYAHRFRYAFLAVMEHAKDLKELEDLRDAAWFRAGWYEVLGYDRQGRSYVTIDDEFGDSLFSYGAQIERDNQYAVGIKER